MHYEVVDVRYQWCVARCISNWSLSAPIDDGILDDDATAGVAIASVGESAWVQQQHLGVMVVLVMCL